MKARRLFLLVVSLIALFGLITVCVTVGSHQRIPSFQATLELRSAMQEFYSDRRMRGEPLPAAVYLDDLVDGGFLSSRSVVAFEGMRVALFRRVGEWLPNSVLMSARLKDGSVIATLGDGSVQQMSAQRFEDVLRSTVQREPPVLEGE